MEATSPAPSPDATPIQPTAPVRGVDCHAHVMRVGAKLDPLRHSEPRRDVHVDEFLRLLDAHGLSHGVLTQPSFYGTDNGLLLDALAQAPHRLRGTVIVDPDIREADLEGLRRRQVVGVRLNWIRRESTPEVGSAPFRSFLARVAAAGLHVEIYLEGPALARVLPCLRASGARVVVDHFGAPDPALGTACPGFREVLKGVAAGDTWVKLSAPYRLAGVDPQACVDALLRAGGPAQLLWASDWPWVSHEDEHSYAACLQALENWIPDAALRQAVLATSPRLVMGLP
ncbi:MAG: amidohydrolase family protein [Betaproteobacteria bacterium]|nr:amidohydrolase family protein [Betaproteobacteria bacterium]